MGSVFDRACQINFTWYACATGAGNAASQSSIVASDVASCRTSATPPPLASSPHPVTYRVGRSNPPTDIVASRSACGEAAPALDAQRATENLLMRVTFNLI
jgi:hypothetical protein